MNVKINAIDYSVENASTVFEAASAAGVVAREHIAAKVNGVVSAMSAPIKEGDEIELLTFADEEGKKVYRHTDPSVLVNERSNELLRLCDMYNIPVATNIGTAEALIIALDRGDLDWRAFVNPRTSHTSHKF